MALGNRLVYNARDKGRKRRAVKTTVLPVAPAPFIQGGHYEAGSRGWWALRCLKGEGEGEEEGTEGRKVQVLPPQHCRAGGDVSMQE